jgi:hypothetical protein
MNKTAVRSVTVGTLTIVTLIIGYLGIRTQLDTARASSHPASAQATAREREEALRVCFKMQADGCYTD